MSQDPIRLKGGNPNIYSYVSDCNNLVDLLGLNPISNKFPEEALPKDGKITPHEITEGKIKGVNGQRSFDFVVTQDGKLVLGKKHHLLGQRQDVLAAGQIRLNGQGQVRSIDNLSGHYRPSVTESMTFPDVLRSAGLDISGATLEVSEFEINEEGFVISQKVVSK